MCKLFPNGELMCIYVRIQASRTVLYKTSISRRVGPLGANLEQIVRQKVNASTVTTCHIQTVRSATACQNFRPR